MRRHLRWDWWSLGSGVLAASFVWIVALIVADALGYIGIATSVPLLSNTPEPVPTEIPQLLTDTPILQPTATPTNDYLPRPPPPDFTPLAPLSEVRAVIQRSEPVVILPTQRPPPSAEQSTCGCSENIYNCDDFERTGYDAQACFMRCSGLTGKDIHDLDRDNDGLACEYR